MSRAGVQQETGSLGNVLFGIFALQMDFITREQLAAAMSAWARDRSRTIARILRDQGVISEPDCALLESVVERHLAKHGHDPAQSLAALTEATAQVAAVRGDLQSMADFQVADGVTVPGPASVPGAVKTNAGDETIDAPAEANDGDRFQLLRLHDRGGLGEVYVALDRELNREVALKRIKDEHADNAQGRARFVVEAEITGNLEHPGVVPIYSLGHDESGRPYYAMRFIKGDNLKLAADRFHHADAEARDCR